MSFHAETTQFKTFHSVLRAISFKDYIIVRPMSEGLKFTLDEMKSVEASAYIPKKMFSSYQINGEDDLIFKIGLREFTECLNIFGDDGQPSIQMNYESTGSELSLLIKHNLDNVTVNCDIKTMTVDDFNYISLAEECNLTKIIITASVFSEILQRLDNAADEMTLTITPDHPYLQLQSTGIGGESSVTISKNSECVSVFECKEKFSAQYAYSHIKQIVKVMHLANTVFISTGQNGLLRLQLKINSDDKQMYVEYYVTSQFAV